MTTKIKRKHSRIADQFCIQPHPTYLPKLQICRVGLYTERFDAVIPTLFLCFLLICYPYILLFFILDMSVF